MLPQLDAHQFVVTARVRATEMLAKTGVGRVFTANEMRPPATITFDYPLAFQNLLKPGELARFRQQGLTARSVSFSTVPKPEGTGANGLVVFTRAGEPPKSLTYTLRPELGADALGRQVVEFMAHDKDPEFPEAMVVSRATPPLTGL